MLIVTNTLSSSIVFSSIQIDQSVLEALPEELQSKIRKVSKRKAVDRGNKCSANDTGTTSLAKAKPIEPVQALPPLSEVSKVCLLLQQHLSCCCDC